MAIAHAPQNSRPNILRAGGFTLIETMIVVAAMLVIATISMMYFTQKIQSDARTSYISSEANDLGLLAQAVTKYVGTPPTSWTAKGTAYQILLADLITAQDLPANFANRNGAVGTSPFYQTYQIWGELDPTDGNPRVAILDTGNISAAQLMRMGSANTTTAVLAIKQTIANAVAQNQWAAGTIAVAANSVTGSGGAWTKDLSSWYTPTPTVAAAAVLIGYPDLSGSNSGGNNGNGSKWGNCNVAQPTATLYNGTASGTAAACSNGMQPIAQWPNCASFNNTMPRYATYPTDVGAIVIGQSDQVGNAVALITGYTQSSDYYGNTVYNPIYTTYRDSWSNDDIYLNGAIVATDTKCVYTGHSQGNLNPGYCYFGSPKPPSSACAVTTGYNTPVSAQALGAQSYDLLCCMPK